MCGNDTVFQLLSLTLFCSISPLGVFWGSSQTLLHLSSPRFSSPAGWASTSGGLSRHELVVARSRSPNLHPVSPPRHLPVWKQSWPLPFSAHPPLALSSHAVIFNPDWSLDSLHPMASCFCQQKQTVKLQLTPAFSGFPKPFSAWAAQLHLLEIFPLITWKATPAFSSARTMRTGPYCLCHGLGEKFGTMYLGFREKLSDPTVHS